jgi:hypothetical protein
MSEIGICDHCGESDVALYHCPVCKLHTCTKPKCAWPHEAGASLVTLDNDWYKCHEPEYEPRLASQIQLLQPTGTDNA